MALWGTKDLVYNTGNVNVNVTTGVVSKQVVQLLGQQVMA